MFIPCMQQTLTTQTTLELLGNFDQINVLTCDLLNWAIIEHHTQLDSVCGYYNTTHIADVFECFICEIRNQYQSGHHMATLSIKQITHNLRVTDVIINADRMFCKCLSMTRTKQHMLVRKHKSLHSWKNKTILNDYDLFHVKQIPSLSSIFGLNCSVYFFKALCKWSGHDARLWYANWVSAWLVQFIIVTWWCQNWCVLKLF